MSRVRAVVIPTSLQAPQEEPPVLRTVDLRLGPERLGVRAQRMDNDIGGGGWVALNVRSMWLSGGVEIQLLSR